MIFTMIAGQDIPALWPLEKNTCTYLVRSLIMNPDYVDDCTFTWQIDSRHADIMAAFSTTRYSTADNCARNALVGVTSTILVTASDNALLTPGPCSLAYFCLEHNKLITPYVRIQRLL